ncbi:MAG: hypothetical protein EOL90_00580 [Spartobacteria bacterium]|nr:hypothetical protein [Spartobacteria bacterium]
MNGRLWIWVLLGLAAGCVRIDAPLPEARGVDRAASPAVLHLDVTCILPGTGPAVSNGVLVARLYEYDPRRADSQAREVARTRLPGVWHRPGQKTMLRFACSGRTAVRRSYYLTAVVYPEGAPAGKSGLYFLDGFQRVLASGNRESLRVALAAVPEEGGPTN